MITTVGMMCRVKMNRLSVARFHMKHSGPCTIKGRGGEFGYPDRHEQIAACGTTAPVDAG